MGIRSTIMQLLSFGMLASLDNNHHRVGLASSQTYEPEVTNKLSEEEMFIKKGFKRFEFSHNGKLVYFYSATKKKANKKFKDYVASLT